MMSKMTCLHEKRFETPIREDTSLFYDKATSHRTSSTPTTYSKTMSAFLVGSPIMAKAAAKPTARVNTTVRAAAAPE